MLRLSSLSIAIKQHNELISTVYDLDLTVAPGEIIGIIGESGSGKTMAALSIMRLLPDIAYFSNTSDIVIDNEHILELSEKKLTKIRGKKVGFIFQNPMTSLNPVFTVGNQLLETICLHQKLNKSEAKDKMLDLLNLVQFSNPKRVIDMYPHELSGGMKQRIIIAIALAANPDYVIADEPTTALDSTTQSQILELLNSLVKQKNIGLILISHNLSAIKKLADKIIVMYAGTIMEMATTSDFFTKQWHPYAKSLLASMPDFAKHKQMLKVIPGIVPKFSIQPQGCRFYSRCYKADATCEFTVQPLHSVAKTTTLVRCQLYAKDDFIGKQCEQRLSAPSTNKVICSVQELTVKYPVPSKIIKRTIGYTVAVKKINFNLIQGEILAIVGESGCGKTTLAKAMVGLEKYSGTIDFKEKISPQIIFQDPYSSLNPKLKVAQILAEATTFYTQDKLSEALEQVGLAREDLFKYPHQFSGGQRQRISIARALLAKPKFLICDEPTSALDVSVQAQIINLLLNLQINQKLTYLFISHDLAVVAHIADRIGIMYQGEIVEIGTTAEIMQAAKHPYTKLLLESNVIK